MLKRGIVFSGPRSQHPEKNLFSQWPGPVVTQDTEHKGQNTGFRGTECT